jgi:hypothetical protein
LLSFFTHFSFEIGDIQGNGNCTNAPCVSMASAGEQGAWEDVMKQDQVGKKRGVPMVNSKWMNWPEKDEYGVGEKVDRSCLGS